MIDEQLQRQKLNIIRASSVLTTSYVAGDVIEVNNKSQLTLLVSFTIGSLTSVTLKLGVSYDGVTYYQVPVLNYNSGGNYSPLLKTITLTATGNWVINISIHARYLKVSAIGTGTVTSSLLEIQSLISDM